MDAREDRAEVAPSLAPFLPYVEAAREAALSALPERWPALEAWLRGALGERQAGPVAVLPIAAAAAAGGDPAQTVGVAAVWRVLLLGVSVLDNLADQDRPGLWNEIGVARAATWAAGLFAVCVDWCARLDLPGQRAANVLAELGDAAVEIASGQDRDLAPPSADLRDLWETTSRKNGRLLALGCALGAAAAVDDPGLVAACRLYGEQLGLALQCFDDLEGAWFQPQSDLAQGKVTLPVAFALEAEGPHRAALADIVAERLLAASEAEVRALLDEAGARRYLVATAMEARDRALAALAALPGAAGVALLEDYVRSPFSRVPELLPAEDAALWTAPSAPAGPAAPTTPPETTAETVG